MFCCCDCACLVISKILLKSNTFSIRAVRHCGKKCVCMFVGGGGALLAYIC